MFFFRISILLCTSLLVLSSFINIITDDKLLTLKCKEKKDTNFLLSLKVTTDKVGRYQIDTVKSYNDIKSNELINNRHQCTSLCYRMNSIVSKLCVNKLECSININEFTMNDDDPGYNSEEILHLQFKCEKKRSSTKPPSSSSDVSSSSSSSSSDASSSSSSDASSIIISHSTNFEEPT